MCPVLVLNMIMKVNETQNLFQEDLPEAEEQKLSIM